MYRILFYGDSNTYGFDPHGFFGGRYFSKANDFLTRNGLGEVDWTLKETEDF